MATYIRGLSDTIPQIQPFQPDFGMVQKTLATLQSRYDQGFASLSNTYNQVLNAPLSDAQNRQSRNMFIKQAEASLKDLSSVDLSLPENVARAEKVFAPFWEDEMILQDANLTKWYNSEIGKALSARDSQDEKVRSQYSDVAVRYLQNGLEKLQNAGREPGNYAKLEKRRFVPFANMEAYLNEQAQKAGFKIEWSTTRGPYLVSTTNGTRAVPAFETFAHNMLGNNFVEQFRVMGTVEKEERVRHIREHNPLITDKAALEMMGSDVFSEIKEGLTSKKQTIQTDREKISNKIAEYEKLPVLQEKQKTAYLELLSQQEQLSAQLDNAGEELSKLIKDEQETKKNIIENPDQYFTGIMKQRTVKGWAHGRAAGEQVKTEMNPVWQEENLINYRKAQLDMEEKKFQLDVKEYELEKWKAENKVKTGKNPDGSGGTASTTSQDPETAGHYDGLGSTDATKVGNAYQVFQERQQQRWNYAHSQIFDIGKGVGSILTTLGVSDADAVRYMDMMKELSSDPMTKFKNDDWEFFRKVGSKLNEETGIEATTGFYNARSALLEAAKKNIADKMKNGGSGITKDDVAMLISYTSAIQALEEHNSLEQQRKQIFKETIATDEKYKNYIVTQPDGTTDFVGVKEIAKLFNKPVYRFRDWDTKEEVKFTREQLAQYYLEGRLTGGRKDQVSINIDGKKLLERPDSTPPGWFGTNLGAAFRSVYNGRANLDLLDIQKQYGSSKDFFKLRQEVNEKVVPNLEEYKSETGKMGFVVRYDLSDKARGDVAAKMINEASLASNREGIYVNGHLNTEDAELNHTVLTIASMGEDELEKYVSTALLKTVGANGRPSLELKFKPFKNNDKTEIDGYSVANLSGKTIEIDINPNATGETLQSIRYNSGYNIYGALTRGKPLKSDPMMEAAGFSFEITPDSTKQPTAAIVRISKKEFKDGNYIDTPPIREVIPFKQKGPDEIVNFMYSLFLQSLSKNLTAQNMYQQQNKTQLLTPQQVREEYQINKAF